jgi:diadenosine tetraphosphate (Ap4A) HIT family hydrolase
VDEGNCSLRLVSDNITVESECRCCAIAQSVADNRTRSGNTYVVQDIDPDVVVVRRPDLDGLLVVPSQHVSGLEELPVPVRAHVLAALQRATQLVLERNPGLATRVVVMTDPPASEDHVCFRVVPALRLTRPFVPRFDPCVSAAGPVGL